MIKKNAEKIRNDLKQGVMKRKKWECLGGGKGIKMKKSKDRIKKKLSKGLNKEKQKFNPDICKLLKK